LQVAQALFQIQAEVFDVNRNLMAGRGQVGADLNIRAAEAGRPFGKQFASDAVMYAANPLRGDVDVFRQFLQ
jgi:hypothetical protein